jgi:putative aldouronate transport system permease protein
MKIWFLILLPLSAPAIATITLWVVVAHWNRYLDALIYITDRSKYVFQIIIRRVLLEDEIEEFLMTSLYAVEEETVGKPTSETMKAAVIMVGTLPLVMVYPFLQRYFVKGIMLGAVKG